MSPQSPATALQDAGALKSIARIPLGFGVRWRESSDDTAFRGCEEWNCNTLPTDPFHATIKTQTKKSSTPSAPQGSHTVPPAPLVCKHFCWTSADRDKALPKSILIRVTKPRDSLFLCPQYEQTINSRNLTRASTYLLMKCNFLCIAAQLHG